MKNILKNFISDLKMQLRGEVPTNKLIKMGLKVGKNFNRLGGCIIDYSHCWLISIGDDVTLAPKVMILAHDASTKMYLNYTKIGLVSVGNRVFIGAGSIILPNVKIGDDVIIGVGSVVTRDIPNGSLAVGNPAKVVAKTDEYISKNRELMKDRPVYDEKWTTRQGITNHQKEIMLKDLYEKIGFVE